MRKKGLIVDVLRCAHLGDGTNGGISSKYNSFVIVDSEVDEIFEPTDNMPILKLVRRTIGGKLYIHAVPLVQVPLNCFGYTFGGNFVYTSDSRLRSISQYPIPVHDRIEPTYVYEESLSR